MFEFNGENWTVEDIQAAADKQGMSYDEAFEKLTQAGMTKSYSLDPRFKPIEDGYFAKPASIRKTPEEIKAEQDAIKAGRINLLLGSNVPIEIAVALEPIVGISAGFSSAIPRLAGGLVEGVDSFWQPLVALATGKSLREVDEMGYDIPGEKLIEIANELSALQSTFYDEKGQQEELIDLIKGGKYDDAGVMAAEQLFANIPQLAISFSMPRAGGALLGASVYGEEFSRQQKERLDQDMSKVYLNSFMKGTSEFGTEYLGGKIGRYASGLSRSGLAKNAVKDFTKNAFVNSLAKAGIGFTGEALTEGATGVFQKLSDAIVFDDEISIQEYFRTFVNDALIGGFLGGTVSGVTYNVNRPTKENIYQLLAPKTWQQEQLAISKKIEKAEAELETADEIAKPIIQKQIDSLKKVEKDNLNKLYSSFDSLTKQELEAYAAEFDRIQGLEKIITGGKKYSDSAKELAETELLQVYATLEGLTGKNVNIDIETELELGRTIRNYQNIVKERGRFGFSKKDLDIKYLETTDQVDKLIESRPDLSGVNKADGMFLTQNKETGKKTIYINMPVASITGQTNVLGHEYLHYIVSRAFKTDAENLKPAVKAFFDYVKSVDSDLATRIEDKIANNYGKIIGYQKNKNNEDIPIRVKRYNSDGLLDLERKDDIEEYFNIFSDLTKNNKIAKVEEKTAGLINSFRTLTRGLGFGKVDFRNGKEIFDFIQDYNTNLSKEGVIGKIAAKRISKVKLTGLKAADKQTTAPTSKESRSYTKTPRDIRIDKLGEQYTKEQWDKRGAEEAIGELYMSGDLEAIVKNNLSSALRDLPGFSEEDFVSETIAELIPHIKNFNINRKEDQASFGLSGWIRGQVNNKIGNVLKAKKATREAFESDIEESTQAQVAVAEEQEIELLEEQDLSLVGQAKALKEKTERQSKFRRQLGFETGGEMYNKVLSSAKKSVLLAYRKTQSIEDPAQRAKAIKDLLRKEYFTSGLTSDLFKATKNFLGTKDYIKNLKEYREAIIEGLSTADLVQMERNVPDNERVFTVFDKKLTKIQEVEDAVNKGLLPTEAINTIGKGTAVNLYRKRMPTEQELVSFADQPAINPVTGQRSGLKGTRKDGFAKAISNTLVLDAVMEVRQSEDVVEALEDDAVAQLDLMALSDAVGREVDVKFSKSTAVAEVEIGLAIGSLNTRAYNNIRFSRSHREAYEARLTKKRTDLSEEQIKGAVESVFKFVDGDNIPNNKKYKYEKLAMHYMANGYLILPEDGYKVIEAERLASIKKIDPFSVGNPNEIIEKYAGTVKAAKINPNNVKELSNPKELYKGVVSYDVEWTKDGQKAVRKIVDSHWGKKSNPWCLIARQGEYYGSDQAYSKQERDEMIAEQEAVGRSVQVTEYKEDGQTVYELTITTKPDPKNELNEAYDHWLSYNKNSKTNKELDGYKLIFQNGKLTHFRDGSRKYWDKQDESTDFLSKNLPDAISKDGYTQKRILNLETGKVEITQEVKETGDKQNGLHVKAKRDYIFDRNGQRYKYEDVRETMYKNGEYVSSTRFEKSDYGKGNIRTFKTTFTEDGRMIRESTETISGELNTDLLTKAKKTIKTLTGKDSALDIKNVLKVKIETKLVGSDFGPTVETYYGEINGKKATIELEHDGDTFITGFKFDDIKVNGESVLPISAKSIKFSMSANDNFEGVKQLTKYSFTKTQTEKVLQAILKEQVTIEKRLNTENEQDGDQTALVLLSELESTIQDDIPPLDAYNKIISKFPQGSANVSFKSPAEFVKYVKETTLPVIRQEGFRSLVKYLENKLENVKTDADRKKIVDSFIRSVGRSARTAKVFGITTNRALKEQVLDQVLSKDLLSQYKLVDAKFGGQTFENVELYENIENIKNNVRNPKSGLREKINEQAEEAREFMLEILDSDLSLPEKYAIIDLLAVDQRGTIRKMYTMGTSVTSGSELFSKELTLEHEITVSDMVSYLKAYAKNENKAEAKKVLEGILNQARVHVLPKGIDDVLNSEGLKSTGGRTRYQNEKVKNYLNDLAKRGIIDSLPIELTEVNDIAILGKALKFSRSANNPTKGITVLDFDDTLATSKSLVKFTRPDGSKGTLTPEQYASTYEDLLSLGYEFDFSEFSKVVDGKPAPLLNKAKKLAGKFGTKNMFILTARPADSAPAIQKFLKENGLDIPLKNITGLGNSTAEAKALWIAEKAAEGYNDFYFADDALKNVQAVDNMLEQFDVKSKVQQARIKFSRSMSDQLNKMIERTKGIGSEQTFDEATAKQLGKDKGKTEIFISSGADDFKGLMMRLAGKGEQGDRDMEFFKENLFDPYNRAYRQMDEYAYNMLNDLDSLIKEYPDVRKRFKQKLKGTEFEIDQAIRIYLWNKNGQEIPGLSEEQAKKIAGKVALDSRLVEFANKLNRIPKLQDKYTDAKENWQAENIKADIYNAVKDSRPGFLDQWQKNVDELFSQENLNKLEAVYGTQYVNDLKNMLYRMKTGENRPTGKDADTNKFLNWINNSVGAIMFFNARSAVLQLLSTVNYLDYQNNNVFAAAKAFANQKQFWSDFVFLFNSPMLKMRRAGTQIDVSAADIAETVRGKRNPAKAVIAYLLRKGFTPTQIGDSLAISFGGATYYRNQVEFYRNQGLSLQKAEEKAFSDFQEKTEEAQQSSRPDKISRQQASVLGRLILAFQNTPMQYNRIIKKAVLDLVNKRGNTGTNISKIIYYGTAQGLIFNALQNAIFALDFDDEEEKMTEDERAKYEKFKNTKYERIIDGMISSLLRGSGLKGAYIDASYNTIKEFQKQREKEWKADHAYTVIKAVNVSPAIGSKLRKLYQATQSDKFNKNIYDHMSYGDINHPVYDIASSAIEATTNAPTQRIHNKLKNISTALGDNIATWQRLALMLGWDRFGLGVEEPDSRVKAKEEAKQEKKEALKNREPKKGEVRCGAITSSGKRCKNLTTNKSGLCYAHE